MKQIENIISSFNEEYFFLSNFFPEYVILEGITYPTAEHAYQAYKVTDPTIRKWFAQLPRPADAKFMGRRAILPDNWNEQRIPVMRKVLHAKFRMPYLAEKLQNTGDALLIEGNNWNDIFWGMVEREGGMVGENHLGELLMEVREKLNSGELL